MKRFYKCPVCKSEFCLKGSKWCKEGGAIYCGGQSNTKHEKIKMAFVGERYQDLVEARK
jgi:hypothetical protein